MRPSERGKPPPIRVTGRFPGAAAQLEQGLVVTLARRQRLLPRPATRKDPARDRGGLPRAPCGVPHGENRV